MYLPGLALLTPLIFAQGEKGVVLRYVSNYLAFGWFYHMSLPFFPSVTPFIIWQGEKRGCFNICLYLALPLSLH